MTPPSQSLGHWAADHWRGAAPPKSSSPCASAAGHLFCVYLFGVLVQLDFLNLNFCPIAKKRRKL